MPALKATTISPSVFSCFISRTLAAAPANVASGSLNVPGFESSPSVATYTSALSTSGYSGSVYELTKTGSLYSMGRVRSVVSYLMRMVANCSLVALPRGSRRSRSPDFTPVMRPLSVAQIMASLA